MLKCIVSFQSLPACEEEGKSVESPHDSPESPKLASAEQPMHQFKTLYQKHLVQSTTLGMTSVELNVRLMTDLIKHSFSDKGEESFHGMGLVKTFLSLGEEGSFIRRRTDTLSGSYCAKVVTAALRVVAFLKAPKTSHRWAIENNVAQHAETFLSNLLKKYQKIEKRERLQSRQEKERNILSPGEMEAILKCQAVNGALESASESLDEENKRPISMKDVTTLRDALITSLAIRSLRRSMEFVEFTLGEWQTRTIEGGETSMIRVKVHKTMAYGSANLVLNRTEERALKAYVLYARPIATSCQKEGCPVFTSRMAGRKDIEACCVKLQLTSVSAILKKVAVKAGVTSRTVNTRMLRRSMISQAWRANSNPSFRQELSQLAGHSYETARRYYAVYDTAQQSRTVVNELEKIRQ